MSFANGDKIILTGFSGTGKSSVAREVAWLLGWRCVDTDAEVVARAGKPIARIFSEEGEPRFRDLERQVLQDTCLGKETVIATGGGVVMDPTNRERMFQSGIVVCLEATPETIYSRLSKSDQGSTSPEVRPLLAGEAPLEQIRSLKGQRQWCYALAHWTVHTDHLSVPNVAQEVVRAWRIFKDRAGVHSVIRDYAGAWIGDPSVTCAVNTSSGTYPVVVGWKLLDDVGRRLRALGVGSTVYLISDTGVPTGYVRLVHRSLEEAGVTTHIFRFPNGEASKNLDTAKAIYEWLAQVRAERGHWVVAVGGGVVGDLAGFVAATFARGVSFVQAPTTLLAMVDAAIGGKVAVDLPEGKNLVGAFHQPRMVLADVSTLATLPRRELVSGMAEAVKHGLILDEALFREFEEKAEALLVLEPDVTTDILRRSVAVKARVVTEDERETTGRRALLNYGHTIGHGLEAATEYHSFLHGEAVAVGMMGAAEISRRLGLLSREDVQRQESMLRRLGLPVRSPGVDPKRVLQAMKVDKKTVGREIKWVLLEGIGRAVVRGGVSQKLVEEVVAELCAV